MDQYIVNENGVLVEFIPENHEEPMYAVVPDGVNVIAESAFQYFAHLKSVTLPNSVVEIESGAFYECYELETINIPESVAQIGDEAFAHCYALADADGFIIVNNVLHGHVGNCEEVVIPSHVTRIGPRVFANREHLKKVVLPEGLTSIGEEAFWYCGKLESIHFPASLIEIGDYAFQGTKIKH